MRSFIFLALILLALGCIALNGNSDLIVGDEGTVSIAFWDLGGFVQDESNERIQAVADMIISYDVIVLHGLTDVSGESFEKICSRLPHFECKLTPVRGDMSKKERHGFIYKKFSLESEKDFAYLLTKDYLRAPFSVTLKQNDFKLRLFTVKMDENNVRNELRALDQLVTREGMSQTENLVRNEVVLGKLWADCEHYEMGTEFASWLWVNDQDTTLDEQECSYDRIIINHNLKKYFVKSEAISAPDKKTSDYKLVYALFKV